MYLFKTSDNTFDIVIRNEKHAFVNSPRNWFVGELVLISKNKKDCKVREKQIQFVTEISNIRHIFPGEAEKYWPGNEGRWNYLVEFTSTRNINIPFNLDEAIGENESAIYKPILTFKKILPEHEKKLMKYL